MKIFNITTTLLMTCFVYSSMNAQKINLKNSNLEGVKDGKFFWWKHQAKEGGKAKFSVENSDVNSGSTKALKAEVKKLGPKGWFVSSSFNQKFPGNIGDEVTVEFYAKSISDQTGKIKLVFQSDVKGSFQGKDFNLTNDWKSYSHSFVVRDKSSNNQIKFWYLKAESIYLIDDLSISKK